MERGEKFDVFDVGDGRKVARLYAAPVNVQTGPGRWAKVDPSLTGDGKGRLTTKATTVPVSFAPSAAAAGDLVRAGSAGRSIGLRAAGAVDAPGTIDGSAVTYKGVWPGADVQFRAGNGLTKTTVVLAAPPAAGASVWRFPLSLDPGLTPKAVPSGGVLILDGAGVEVASVATPLMWDSKADPASGDPGVYGPVTLTVEGDAKAGWTLVLSADPSWLTAKDRVYPVHVDPTLDFRPGGSDAFVASGFPNNNYNVAWNSAYGRYENRVGRYDSTWGEGRAELQFDLSPVMGSTVWGADLNLHFFHTYTIAPTWFRVQHLNCGWNASTVTWNNQPCWSGQIADSAAGRGHWASVDIGSWVANQASGGWANAGYAVQAGAATGDFKRMASMENADGSAPFLEVSFNRAPSQATPVAPSPPNGWSGHVGDAGITLAANASDPDGDPVQYWFRVATGADGETNQVYNSGWTSSTSVTVPLDALAAGRPYYWHVHTSDGYNNPAPNWVWSFTPTNADPPKANIAAATPSPNEVVTGLTPTLSVPAVTDHDGDPVKYWFKVATGPDGLTGQVVSSGWQTTPTWTVPAGVLKDGVPYTWTVTTSDSRLKWKLPEGEVRRAENLSDVGRFRVDLRHGLGKTVPTDSVGGVSVNLFNGNSVVTAGSPSMSTAGGDVGVGFTYNSAKSPEQGLVGSYYDGLGNRDFPAEDAPELVRTDAQVTFDWGAGSPHAPAVAADGFRIRWTGYVSVPTSGTYEFGVTRDDGVRVVIDGTTVLDQWNDAALADQYGTGKALTAGSAVPITVEYYENGGGAQIKLLVRQAGGAGYEVPASWLSPAPPALPTGWTLSADVDGDGGYVGARATDTAVVLTDASGATHTYTRRSDGSYSPPQGEHGVLARDDAGMLALTDGDGRAYRFDAAGKVLTATTPADDRKPASAAYTWAGAPARLATITDPASGRVIGLRYQGRDTCPAPPAGGYDQAPPPGMLCQIDYPDGSNTGVYYAAGQLAGIVDPGGEVTQFRYTSGRMSSYRAPLAVDWVAKDPTSRDTDATWALIGYDTDGRTARVQSPEPSGTAATPSGRLGHSYSYDRSTPSAPVSRVRNDGDPAGVIASTVTMDAAGRPVTTTTAAGATTATVWSASDLPLRVTDPAGRVTTTIYDWEDRPTDTFGPAPAACFQANGLPVSAPPGECGQIPHSHTGYDTDTTGTRLSGLEATHHDNPNLTGTPTGRATLGVDPGSWPAGFTAAGQATRLSGSLTLPPGSHTIAATVADPARDGIRVYIGDQPVIDRWSTPREAVLADTPTGYWRLGSTSAETGPTLAATGGVGFTGPALSPAEPIPTATFATGSLALPEGTLGSVAGAGASPGVEVWFRTTTPGVIFGYQNPAATAYVPALYVDTDGVLRGQFWTGTVGPIDSGRSVTDGAWHHAALVTSAPDGTGARDQYLYLDGAQVGTLRGVINLLDMTQAQFGTGKSALWPESCATDWCAFTGSLAEAALYNHPLTPARIGAHYQAGKATLTGTTTSSPLSSTVVAGTLPAAPAATPQRIRIEYKSPAAPVGAGSFTLTDNGSVIPSGAYTPRYGLGTWSVTDDSGGATPTMTSATSYADPAAGIDPALGLATASVADPAGAGLTTRTGYEPYLGAGGLLRPVSRTLPSGTATTAVTEYYAAKTDTTGAETRTNPCPGGTTASQHGLAKATTEATPAAGLADVVESIYDVWGRVVATGHRDGAATPTSWTCTSYDTRGRVTSVAHPAYGGAPARTVTHDHAVGANPLTSSVADPAGTITTTVDLTGRTTSYTHTVPDKAGQTVTTTTSYDPAGRTNAVTTTATAGGTSTVGYTYLPDGRLATTTVDGTTVATTAYDPSTKELSGVAYPNGISLGGLTKNPAGAQVGATWTVGSRTFTETLTRSRAGRITRSVATDSAAPANTIDWSYSYDTAARLTSAVLAGAGPRPTLTLGYGYTATGGCGADPAAGANGSRVAATTQLGTGPVTSTSWCTDAASRITAVTGAEAIPAEAVSYDSHGNTTRLGSQRFSYDGEDRVTATSEAGGAQTLTYTRDATDRVTKRAATGTDTGNTWYAFTDDTDSPDFRLTPTGALAERYLSLPGGLLYTKRMTTGITYGLPNLHGDITTTIGGGGAVIGTGYIYDPYGQPRNRAAGTVDTASVPDTRNGTTTTDAWHGTAQRGYEHTGGLNQILMGARTYLPAHGTFTATDPITGGNTTTYAYPQDPINRSDLTGEIDWGSVGGWIQNAASAAVNYVKENPWEVALTVACFIPVTSGLAWGYRAYKVVSLATRAFEVGSTSTKVVNATRATSWLAGRMWVGRGASTRKLPNGSKMRYKGDGAKQRAWRSSAKKGPYGYSSNLNVSVQGRHDYQNFHINHRAPKRYMPWR